MTNQTLVWVCLTICLVGTSALAQDTEKTIALTFDDLPALGPLGYWRPREISNMILRSLQARGIQTVGFVVEAQVEEDPSSYVVLDDWASQGHILGNQTHSDVDLNEAAPDDFLEHVADGQRSLKQLARVHSFNYRYFRYPYLHQGPTEEVKQRVARLLARAEYTVVPVTVKSSDYRFNSPFVEIQRDTPERMDRLKELYLRHLEESLDYSERQSQKVFSRNIPHILWLRCGIATAHFLDDLLQLLEKRGYRFISPQAALTDTAYQQEDDYAGPLALSHIDRVAATRGLPFESEQGEISRSEIERRLAN